MKICVDFDSTLNDLNVAWQSWILEHYGEKVTNEDVVHFDWLQEKFGPNSQLFYRTPGHYRELVKPIPGSVDFVEFCRSLVGDENFRVVTSSPEHMEEEKTEFLVHHYGLKPEQVVHAHDKREACAGAVLVDDYPLNVARHVEDIKLPALLFDLGGTYGWSKTAAYDFWDVKKHEQLTYRVYDYDRAIDVLSWLRRKLL